MKQKNWKKDFKMATGIKNKKIEYIDSFLKGIIKICQTISQESIDQFIENLFQAWFKGHTIFIIGNGGSASTASHFAADLNNCLTNIPNTYPVKAISLVDNIARITALTNDQGWENVYTEQLKNFFQPGDLVIAISVHGGSGRKKAGAWSQNLLKALQYAKDNGGKALGLAGFDGGAMKNLCDVCIIVPYNTTPHVEGFHMVLHHLIYDCLPKKVISFLKAASNI